MLSLWIKATGKLNMGPSLQQLLFILSLNMAVTAAWSTTCSYDMKPWQPNWTNDTRDDLLCSNYYCPELEVGVLYGNEDINKCCTCQSCTTWEGAEIELHIEYVSVLGRSLAIFDQPPNASEVYKIENQFSEMTELPSNICNWDNETGLHEMYAEQFTNMETFWENLVTLDFTGSKIRKIPDINCLVRLDSLILVKNNINSVSNSSFTNLSRLRLVNLEGNRLKTLDPGIFTAPTLNIFFALFRDNEMEKLDVSNMFSRYPFCTIDFEDNEITHLVNENDFKLDMDKTYGPGFVSFENNEIDAFPNYKDLLQLDSWEQMGKLFSFGFDYRGVPIICDCNLVPFLSLAQEIIDVIWLDYFNVTCTGPENHVGKPVHRIPLDELICPIPQHKGCQAPECTCVDRPQEDTLYIDCSYQNLKKLPGIPMSNHSRYVSLNVSGNNIQYIANMSYLPKLRSFDISKNDLHGISNDIAKQLENCTDIDISYNSKIEKLPQLFQYRNICNTDMRGIVVTCICETQWLETWVASRECDENNLFRCDIPEEGVKNAKSFNASDLGCFLNNFIFVIISIGGVVFFLILTGTLSYWFRYELLIIYLRLRQKKRNAIQVVHKHDVFISFNDNEEHVTEWIVHSLEPRLRKSRFKTYIACKDMAPGADRSTEVKEAINNSRNTLLVLSDGYLKKNEQGIRPWTENEWKFGWCNFKHDRGKNIVLVNFDHLEPTDVDHPVIKAYVRVGCTVDFTNHDRNIMDDIETKLGKPIRDINSKGLDNKNIRFPSMNIFIVGPDKNVLYDDDIDIDDDEIVLEEDKKYGPYRPVTPGNTKFGTHKTKVCKYRKCYACQLKQQQQQQQQQLEEAKYYKKSRRDEMKV